MVNACEILFIFFFFLIYKSKMLAVCHVCFPGRGVIKESPEVLITQESPKGHLGKSFNGKRGCL